MAISKLLWNLKVLACRLRHFRDVVSSEDRKALEYHAFFHLVNQLRPQHVLFVGVEPYTKWYYKLFSEGVFETIDSNPDNAAYGSPRHHRVADVRNAAELWRPERFDLVVINGVYGYGIDAPQDLRTVLAGLTKILKPRGVLMFGWNRNPHRDSPQLEDPLEDCFQDFQPYSVAGRDKWYFREWRRHAFYFFQRAGDRDAA